MEKSLLVLTDSGGIQEEAPGLGKPVLVMRDTTERPEALSAGTVKLVGTNYDVIVGEVSNLIDNVEAYNKMSKAVNPYGDGLACGRIADYLFQIDIFFSTMTKQETQIMKGVAILLMIFLHLFNQMSNVELCRSFIYIGDIPFVYWLSAAANPVAFF